MHIACGHTLEYVSIASGPGLRVGETKACEPPGPVAPPDGSVNWCMFMVSVAGAIAEELVTGLGYGRDRQARSDYDRALEWASRGGELSEEATQVNLRRGWAEAEHHLKKRWSHVEALARALVARRTLSGPEVVGLLMDLPLVPYADEK